MADIHHYVTRGIGPSSTIEGFILRGLNVGASSVVDDFLNALTGLSDISGGMPTMFGFILGSGKKTLSSVKHSSKLNAAAGAAAGITLAAGGAGNQHVITQITWSYGADPTGGKITITGGSANFEYDITKGGPGSLPVTYVGLVNTEVVVTLAAGGGSVQGKLNVSYTTELYG